MNSIRNTAFIIFGFGLFVLGAMNGQASPSPQVTANYGKLPLAFVKNCNIYPEQVEFYLKTKQSNVFFTRTGLLFQSFNGQRSLAYRLHFVNAQSKVVVGQTELAGRLHYLLGKNPQKWNTNVNACVKSHFFLGRVASEL